jgi:hypothetical protein
MRVETDKQTESFYMFLATYWNLSKKSGDLNVIFSWKSGEFGPFFP